MRTTLFAIVFTFVAVCAQAQTVELKKGQSPTLVMKMTGCSLDHTAAVLRDSGIRLEDTRRLHVGTKIVLDSCRMTTDDKMVKESEEILATEREISGLLSSIVNMTATTSVAVKTTANEQEQLQNSELQRQLNVANARIAELERQNIELSQQIADKTRLVKLIGIICLAVLLMVIGAVACVVLRRKSRIADAQVVASLDSLRGDGAQPVWPSLGDAMDIDLSLLNMAPPLNQTPEPSPEGTWPPRRSGVDDFVIDLNKPPPC